MIYKNSFCMDHVCCWFMVHLGLDLGGFGFGYLGVSLMINQNPFALNQVCAGLCYFHFLGGLRFLFSCCEKIVLSFRFSHFEKQDSIEFENMAFVRKQPHKI